MRCIYLECISFFMKAVRNMILEEILEQGLTEWKIPYNGTTLDRFRHYYTLLEETNKVMNLTAIEGEKDTAQLHFLDCAALLRTNVMEGKTVADIGTGAGFPGMVLKILCPETEFVLIDSLDKRIRFLQEVCEELQLSGIRCIHARAEELPAEYRERFDLVTSRAVARLAILSELCVPYTRQGGRFVSMKGPGCQEETVEAAEAIRKLGGKPPKITEYQIPGTEIVHSLVTVEKDGITSRQYPRRWAQIKKSHL